MTIMNIEDKQATIGIEKKGKVNKKEVPVSKKSTSGYGCMANTITKLKSKDHPFFSQHKDSDFNGVMSKLRGLRYAI